MPPRRSRYACLLDETLEPIGSVVLYNSHTLDEGPPWDTFLFRDIREPWAAAWRCGHDDD
jgi:hypothetical protein